MKYPDDINREEIRGPDNPDAHMIVTASTGIRFKGYVPGDEKGLYRQEVNEFVEDGTTSLVYCICGRWFGHDDTAFKLARDHLDENRGR